MRFVLAGCVLTLMCAHGASAQQIARRTAVVTRTIGAAGDGDDGFAYIADVKVARDGRIFVLDMADALVKSYDSTGKFIRRFGRKGDGPGEFVSPTTLIVSEKEVTVRARGKWREAVFTLDGAHVRTRNLDRTDYLRAVFPVRGGGSVVETSPQILGFTAPPSTIARVAWLAQRGGGAIDTLTRIRPDTVWAHREGQRGGSPSTMPFGASGAWALLGDSIFAYADGYTGRVVWHTLSAQGSVVSRTASLARTGIPILPEDIAAEARHLSATVTSIASGRGGVSRVTAPFVLEVTPTTWSIATKALFSTDGTLWVGTQRAKWPRATLTAERDHLNKNIWTAFPASGEPYEVELPRTVVITAARGNMLYGHGSNADDERIVVVYSVR